MRKLSLGTAQFGLNYGISNQTGKVKVQEVKKILQLAKNSNIDTIDTAIIYGDSEKIIGDIGFKNFQIITKLPALHEDCEDIYSWVEKNVKLSLKRLKTPSLYGLLVHKTEDLFGNYGMKLINALKIIKKNGLVKKIGISIYDPSECEKVMKLTRMDIVQAPLNIIDRRLDNSGWLSRLHAEEVEIHTRSVFLQGLLLMPRNRIPNIFNKWSEVWDQWALKLKNNNLSPLEACLSYPLSLPEIDKIIVGVENVNQLRDIIDKSKSKKTKNDFSFMISKDQMLINPSNW
jgi:aryl-alcohol dehydrogenase-like predicted oxidoreductase